MSFEVIEITTAGDRMTTPLHQGENRGVFVSELEEALRMGTVDIAIHSLKDLPTEEFPDLVIAAIPTRADPRDVLVCQAGWTLAQLPPQSRVGTSSLRRQAQLLAQRPDLHVQDLRGNVDTRLRKVAQGELDAAVMAAAGLLRLGRTESISEYLDPQVFVPAPGQGALAIQVRADDGETISLVAPLDDIATRAASIAERSFLHALGGGCQVPIAAHATVDGDRLCLHGLVATPDGRSIIREHLSSSLSDPDILGRELAALLLAAGAAGILAGLITPSDRRST
jgi:hydroxymethylbilane synthase